MRFTLEDTSTTQRKDPHNIAVQSLELGQKLGMILGTELGQGHKSFKIITHQTHCRMEMPQTTQSSGRLRQSDGQGENSKKVHQYWTGTPEGTFIFLGTAGALL